MSIAGANPIHRKFAAGICALLVAGLGAGTASAGELTGNGEPTGARTHASSICAYSGQNDHPEAPLSLEPDVAPNGPGGRTQSFGQNVKLGADPHVFNPGDACGHDTNPNRL
jgi:hypothetical protein